MADSPHVTRRHVLAGVAWATPVVLLATSVPAMAASGAAGAIALADVEATISATSLFASVMVVYAGDGAPSPDLPVTTVRAEVSLPTSRAAAGTPAVSGAGWTYTSRTTSGSNTIFTFTWVGADLSASASTTTELVATIPKTASQSALTVAMTGRGVSGVTNVSTATSTLVADIAGTLAFVTGAANRVTYVASVSPPGAGGAIPAYRIRGNVRNSGAAASQPITGVSVSLAIPAAQVTGERFDRTATSVGAGWTLASGPTLVSGVWQLTYTYATSLAGGAATTALDFVMKAIPPKALNVATLSASGTSDGLTLTATHVGPTS